MVEKTQFEMTWPPGHIYSDNPLLNATVKNLYRLDERMDHMEHKLDKVIDMLGRNNDATETTLSILNTFQTIGKMAKWVGVVAGAIVAVAGAVTAIKVMAG